MHRPASVPADATWNPDENEWELGTKNDAGQPIGPWIWWYPSGQKVCEATHDDEGKLHGLLTRWHESGERSQWAPWTHGKTHGVQVWTRPTSGPCDPTCVLPPNLPDRVIRMDMPYEHGVAQPNHFTLYLEAGRDDPVPTDAEGRSVDLAAHLHKVDTDTVLLPVVDRFTCLDGTEVEADPADGRWIYQGPVDGGFRVRHRQGSDKTDLDLSPAETSRAFTLSADWFLTWRDRSRPDGVPPEATYAPRTETWSHGPELDGRRHGRWQTWRTDGSLRAVETYAHGVLEGPFERLHPDGATARTGQHAAGRETGTITWFRSDATDEAFPRRAGEAVHKAEVDQDTDETRWFLADGRPCNRQGVPLSEAHHDEWFAADPADFLHTGFLAYLDAFCPKEEQVDRDELSAASQDLWGHPPPPDLLAVVGETIDRRGPLLLEWRMGVEFLEPSEANSFEQIVEIAQENYLSFDLIELFGGLQWVGSLGNGDGWLVSLTEHHLDASTPPRVYLFDHDELGLDPAAARSLSHLAFLTTLQDAWRDTESISPEALRDAVHRIAPHTAPPWHFQDLFEQNDAEPSYDAESEPSRYLWSISTWIIALLRNDGIVELDDIPHHFHAELFPDIDDKPWSDRMAGAIQHVPFGLYWLWRLFFFGDDVRLRELIDACAESPARLLRDASALLAQILDGRKQLGTIEDIHALREAFQALDLDPARAEARAAEEEAARIAAEAHREQVKAAVAALPADALLDEAWAHLADADWIAATVHRWRAEAEGPTWRWIDALQDDLRMDDPEAWALTERLKEQPDPTLVPLLVSSVREDQAAHIGRHLLLALRPAEAVDPLLPLLQKPETYRHNHTMIAQLAGHHRRADSLPILTAALKLPMEGLEKHRNEDYVQACIVALGRIGGPDAVGALVSALGRHPSKLLAPALADADAVDAVPMLVGDITEAPSPELLWALATLAPQADDDVRAEVVAAAASLEDQSLATMTVRGHLLRALGQEVDDLRRWVRTCLAPETVRYSEDPSIAQKVWALRVAGAHEDLEPDIVLDWVHDQIPALRSAAREAAAARGLQVPPTRVVDPWSLQAEDLDRLHELLADPAVIPRHLVADAMASHGDPRSGEPLLTAVDAFLRTWHPRWSGQDTPRLLRSLLGALEALEAPEWTTACLHCLEDGRKHVIDPVLRTPAPADPALLPGMVRIEREDGGWRQRSATEWLEAFPDAEAVAAARGA
mgnify:CR=1 FL=1